MRSFFFAGAIAWLLLAAPAPGADLAAGSEPPSDASIREMLELAQSRQLVDGMKTQLDGMVRASMQEAMQKALHGNTMTPEQEAVLEEMRSKMMAVVDDTLSWDALLPIYMRTYRASFTQDELDGMTAFYKTPAGQALIRKMPLVMQNILGEMQGIMRPMQQRIMDIQRETLQRLNAAGPVKPSNP